MVSVRARALWPMVSLCRRAAGAIISGGSTRRAAIVDATVRRARPVVLTALASILAMIPLSGSAFWGPMAFTIMGGLFVATFLTLLFLPALYAMWFRRTLDVVSPAASPPVGETLQAGQPPAPAPAPRFAMAAE